MVWLLPTYNRPEKCQAVLDQIIEVGCSTPGVVIVNGPTTTGHDYPPLFLPDGWRVVTLTENIGVCGAMQWYFTENPHDDFYGLICDDEYVFTPGWDVILTRAAGAGKIAFGNDGWQSGDVANGKRQHGYVTWGGDLVRAVGFLSLPGLWHWYHDDVWEAIADAAGLNVFCSEVRVEHRHYRAGAAPKDATYLAGESRAAEDRGTYMKWRMSGFSDVMQRIWKMQRA